MKKIISLMLISLLAFSGTAFAKGGNVGQCVSQCVKVFNKSVNDKGTNPDKLGKFIQTECSEWCKNDYVAGEGFFWADGVCNDSFAKADPDCEEVTGWKALGDVCAGDFECQTGNCVYDFFMPTPFCGPPR